MAKIWKRKDRDTWIVDYRDRNGKRVRLTAPTRQDAEDLLADKNKEKRDGTVLAEKDRDITVEAYSERWLTAMQLEIEPKTRRGYIQSFESHIIPLMGHLKIRELRVGHIKALLREKQSVGFGKNKDQRYAQNSLRLIKAALSSMLTDAVEEDGIISINPALQLSQRKKRNRLGAGAGPEANPLDWAQAAAFFSTAQQLEDEGRLPYRLRVMWTMSYLTGIRPEEAYGLKIGDIDFSHHVLKVQRAISLGKVKVTKTTKDREVDLADDLLPLLENFILFVKAEAVAQNWPEPYWLFPNAQGAPVQESDERRNRKLFARVLSEAALPDRFTPYDLRHTFASLLLSAGAPLLYVSEQMGHANPTTTLKHYSKWMPKGKQRFVNGLAGVLGKTVGTKGWHQVDIIQREDSQPVEKYGGASGDRCPGPLIAYQLQIKSQLQAVFVWV